MKMIVSRFTSTCLSASLVCLLLLLLAGCDWNRTEVVVEENERAFQRARTFQREGRMEEALSSYLQVIDSRRDAAESHFEAGYLFLREIQDPVRAIYHFQRHLELRPNSPQNAQVRELIETAQKLFVRQLPASPFRNDINRLDLMEQLEAERAKSAGLQARLTETERNLQRMEIALANATGGRTSSGTTAPATTSTATSQQRTPAPTEASPQAAPNMHRIQAGDTLSSISRRYYGTPNRWMEIFEANRDRMASPNALRVGEEIRIP
jgi:LysM repeat protein